MAINKRKILDSAQKHLQKGALDKALKDYETLLKADPKDGNVRLKIGDIQLKRGKRDEAITAYLKVAESFMKDGFDAKAVALYKQITKIDDKRVDVFVPLAELYERMGLQSDAMKALQQAADVHYRDGQKDKALDLLRRMAGLDPSNTTNRIKVADLLRQEERNDEAISEYEAVAEELGRQGAEEDRIRILVRVLELAPDRVDLMASVGRSRLDSGNFEAGEKTARMMIERRPDEPDGYELLGEALDGLGRTEDRVAAYRKAAEIHRERGNDDLARDLTQRFVAPGGVEEAAPDDEADDLLLGDEVTDLGGQDPAETDPGFDPNAMSLDSPIGDLAEGEEPAPATEAPLPPLPAASVADTSAPAEGDPDQLLAEASVYLRYGKHDRAIESLRAIVAQDATHVLALSKLGDALQASGQTVPAVAAYERAAAAALAGQETAAFDAIRQSLAAIDPEAAAALGGAPEAPVEAAAPEAEEIDLELDVEIDDGIDDGEASADDSAAAAPVAGDDAPDLQLEAPASDEIDAAAAADAEIELSDSDVEIELSDSDAEIGLPEPEVEIELTADADVALQEVDDDAAISLPDVEFDEEDTDEVAAAPVAADELDVEIEFEDEIEAGSPDAPELQQAAAPSDADPVMDDVEIDVDLGLDDELSVETAEEDSGLAPLEGELDVGEVSEEEVPAAPVSAASATTPAQVAEDLEEADFFYQQGMLDEAREIYQRILAAAPNHPQALLRIGELDAASGAPPVGVPESDEEGVDLVGDDLFDDEQSDVEDDPNASSVPVLDLSAEFGDEDEDQGEEDTGPFDAEADVTVAAAPAPGEADVTAPVVEPDLGEATVSDMAPVAEAAEPEEAADPAEAADPGQDSEPEQAADPAKDSEPSAEPDDGEAAFDLGAAAGVADDYDLAAQLSDVFEVDEYSQSGSNLGLGTEDEGFEQVFAAFKQGVEGALEDTDFEAHYDLGIAYKEMGLVEDAIGEFTAAMGSPERRLPCLHMMGLCSLELQRVPDAIAHFEQALALPDTPDDQQMALRFDLGRAYAQGGDVARARDAFEAVQAEDPGFQDVGAQLEALEGLGDAPVDAAADAEEAFESFDDLMAEETAEPVAAEPEYESFDEFMGDDEDDDASADEPGPEAAEPFEASDDAPEEEPDEGGSDAAPEPEAAAEEPEPTPKKPGRRKKKISFV